MKTTKLLLIGAAMLLAIPAIAQEKKEETKVEPKTDYKDAFLGLALEKTKLYTGKVEDVLGKGVELAQKEAPELAKEYLTWKFWSHIISGGVPLTMLIVMTSASAILFRIGNKKANTREDEAPYYIAAGFAAVVAFGFFMFTVTVGINEFKSAIQIKVAPRIYLIERMAEIVKR